MRIDPKFLSTTTPAFTGLTNLKVFLGVTQIGDAKDWALSDGPNPLIYNFGTDVILPTGVQKTLTIKST